MQGCANHKSGSVVRLLCAAHLLLDAPEKRAPIPTCEPAHIHSQHAPHVCVLQQWCQGSLLCHQSHILMCTNITLRHNVPCRHHVPFTLLSLGRHLNQHP